MYLSNQILLLVYTHSSVPEHTHIKKQYPAIYVINLLLHQFPFVAFDRQVQGSQKQWEFFQSHSTLKADFMSFMSQGIWLMEDTFWSEWGKQRGSPREQQDGKQ